VAGVVAASCAMAQGGDLYVNKATGKNSFDGSKEKPFKNIQKAIDKAENGDIIHVAAGNYYGIMDRGIIKLTKHVSILGGYSADFGERDILVNLTTVMPLNKVDLNRTDALFSIEQGNLQGETLIDGLIFDQGASNDYHGDKGKPEGLEGGILMIPPARSSTTAFNSANIAIMKGNTAGNFTVRNCLFNNACNYGIQVAHGEGTFAASNNVFVANRMAALEIRGRVNKPNVVKAEIINNTVIFTWSRTIEMNDMGYAVRGMNGCDYNISGNILALSSFAGYDGGRVESPGRVKHISLDKNLFFLNKQADMTAPGAGMFQRLWVEEHFEDLPDLELQGVEFKSVEGNKGMGTAEALKSAINLPYLDGFLAASYKEVTSYDADSPANTFRRAMGLNQMGTMKSSVSMWANRYPQADALKLFGALSEYGAQKPN
jgi:hypothetical protein